MSEFELCISTNQSWFISNGRERERDYMLWYKRDEGHLGEDSRVNDVLSTEAIAATFIIVGLE